MHTPQPIRVAPVDAALHRALLALHVRPQQRDYVGAIADLLADAANCAECEPMAILHGDTPVGYCRIDAHARSVAGRDFGLPALGLRAFFIDAAWQGRGLGTQALAALIADLAERRRQARLLVLAVASGNRPALRLYRRAGFVDSGALYHGGRSGPQLLLRRDLP
ncbi:MAG: GNAT family N-acetyltransferase [Xanthomonadaceae bacterium]|jgi:RimJ/RimL family protein N-acetyltransferase|nr:GNAT family N-acetyltransferase [Xanthomonadaceae bacterium]MDE3072136.1 GNAT family N-acetyltransferase [Pseudomonadota bacterium]